MTAWTDVRTQDIRIGGTDLIIAARQCGPALEAVTADGRHWLSRYGSFWTAR